jgi:hypothetical protein
MTRLWHAVRPRTAFEWSGVLGLVALGLFAWWIPVGVVAVAATCAAVSDDAMWGESSAAVKPVR